MGKKLIHASAGLKHASPIPQGVIANGFIFLSAIRGIDFETQQLVVDVEEQARQAFRVLSSTLESVGASLADVVQVGVFMKNLQQSRPIFNRVWEEVFGAEPPARFAVEVNDLGAAGDCTEFLLSVTAAVP